MVLVAVYGTLRKGNWNHHLINQEPLSTEWLPNWELGKGMLAAQRTTNPHKLMVEVYEVNEQTLRRLDSLEGYYEGKTPDWGYQRITTKTSIGDAYIYELKFSGEPHINGDFTQQRFLENTF